MSVKHYIKTGKMVKTDDGWVPEQRFVITTPIKAIRLMCIECMGNQMQHVQGCTAHTCLCTRTAWEMPIRNPKNNAP